MTLHACHSTGWGATRVAPCSWQSTLDTKLPRSLTSAKQLYSTWLAGRQAESNGLLKLCILHISCLHQVLLLLLLLQQDGDGGVAVWQVPLDRVCQVRCWDMCWTAAVAQA